MREIRFASDRPPRSAFVCVAAATAASLLPRRCCSFGPGVDARWKAALASLLSLILDAARLDAAPSDLQSTLEDCGWPAGGAEVQAAARLYAQHKEALRIGGTHAIPPLPSLHTLSSTLYPSIIDVHWRVDDVVRADPAAPPSALHQPHYRLQLTTTTPGSAATTEYAFSCTLQQMQDLLSKLKDAQKQIQQKIE